MEIVRINDYIDKRFGDVALRQHGCFLVDGSPVEIEITTSDSAVVRGDTVNICPQLFERFRFNAPHITRFYDDKGNVLAVFPDEKRIEIAVCKLQPSQFFVNADKLRAIESFVFDEKDIVVQACRFGDKFVVADGHTRLYLAAKRGYKSVQAVLTDADDYVADFVDEAKKRGINAPEDMILLSHEEYQIQWNEYCDKYFESKNEKEET